MSPTVEAVGAAAACERAPILNGASSTISAKGAEQQQKEPNRRNADNPDARNIRRHAHDHDRDTHDKASMPPANHGNSRVRYATNSVG